MVKTRHTSSETQQNHCRHWCLGPRNVGNRFTRKDQVPEITGTAQHTDGGSLTRHFSQDIKVVLWRLQRIHAKSTSWDDGLMMFVGSWLVVGWGLGDRWVAVTRMLLKCGVPCMAARWWLGGGSVPVNWLHKGITGGNRQYQYPILCNRPFP